MGSYSLSTEKGCPFCGFSKCRGLGCMFFGPINKDDHDCILLASYWLTAATLGNAALLRATNFDHNPHLSVLDLRPEAAQKRIDAILQASEALEALETDVCMSAETKAALADTKTALAKYRNSLKSGVEIGEKLARSPVRRKKKG